MNRVTIRLPQMYADHHVLNVRQAVTGLQGVQEIIASAARRQVMITYDESLLSADQIIAALTGAGYPPDQQVQLAPIVERSQDGSAWYNVLQRTTTTERRDLEMSGDFRRY
ncbi:MAG: heavy-metal-associated domain-containing protein [Chloroflexi bacterium]|jgi:copper chaperone CopZ|nr:heavy-metal-associated domain-containing protein [Chloroflexota bacterium]